jgi:Uncharacterized protein conserved in bacteria (DUF2066)
MGTTLKICRFVVRLAFLCLLVLAPAIHQAWAAGPIETSIFAVQGVEVDVTDIDAGTAKNKALIAAQLKAFPMLAERLGDASLVEAVSKLDEKQVLPYLKSLSIEEESISPGRYKGKLTVRFLPAKIKALYHQYGVQVAAEQGPSFLVLPIWKNDVGQVLWDDNPWRKAWNDLHAEQSPIPILVPLGDNEDSQAISVTDVVSGDKVKLEALRRRYDVKTIVIAYAEPAEGGGIHATMTGESPLGTLNFDKVYTSDTGTIPDSAALAVQRFHQVMTDKFKSDQGKVAAQAAEAKAAADRNSRHGLSVSVPFGGPSEWNGLRSRIMSTPGVVGLDVSSLSAGGAIVNLAYMGSIQDMQNSFQASGLNLSKDSGAWVIANH